VTHVGLRWRLPALATLAALAALAALVVGWTPAARAAARRTPTLSPANTVIDGPSGDIVNLTAMSVARDGTGGLVYVKNVDGVAHIFVSRLLGGTFQAPVQVDAGMATASTQPVIAAGQGGLLLVGFVNSGGIYVAEATSSQSPVAAPGLLVSGAVNPSLSLNTFGKAYLAYTTDTPGAPADVQAAFYYQGAWALDPTPLNADPGEDAGTGTGRPQVVASGDGIGIVVWGEHGHVYTRRLSGTVPSVVFEQADTPTIDGAGEVSTSDPMIASGGDSSYASVAFQEEVTSGGVRQSRIVMNHLHASQYDGIFDADGLTPGGEGADQPATAVTEFGAGWVTSETDQTHELFGGLLSTNAAAASVQRIDSSPNSADPDAVPATAGVYSTLIAWQQTPGVSGPAEIRVRYAPNGYDLGPEEVVSSPALGPANADRGLVAGGDVAGDAAIAWVQGTGAGRQIVAGQLYQPPGNFVPLYTHRYATSSDPLLSWSNSAESWGLAHYAVDFDGVPLGQTYGTEVRTPTSVAQGLHTWEVTTTNQAGLTTAARAATVFVDTVAPKAAIKLTGRKIVAQTQRAAVTDSDPPSPGAAPATASGIATAQLRWGDGTKVALGRKPVTHIYRRAGRYTVTVIVTDRAGNRTVITRELTIKPKPKPKPKPKKKKVKSKTKGATTRHAHRGSRR
jgi:hypothetical protein